MNKLRTYPVPASIQSAHIGHEVTLDQLETIVLHDSPASEWAYRIVSAENERQLDKVAEPNGNIPGGLLASGREDEDGVVALINGRGQVWKSSTKGYEPRIVETPDTIVLTADEVAYVARALDEGREMVVLTAALPLGWLDPILGATVDSVSAVQLPDGSQVVAVVDDLDKNAVLDLLAVAPGPHVYRRNAGEWNEDDGWVSILRSLKPPPLVAVGTDIRDQVIRQVDEATAGQKFVATKETSLRGAGFGLLDEIQRQADEALLAFTLLGATNVGARARARASDITGVMPPHLQKYWLVGKGAAKIRWGTPGAWRRCYRNLVKYMGPLRAPGACTNLGQKLGGRGVAWDVEHGGARRAAHAVARAAH